MKCLSILSKDIHYTYKKVLNIGETGIGMEDTRHIWAIHKALYVCVADVRHVRHMRWTVR